jgi:cytochrome c biogenesis protein CcmG/thiol:disulfide interchange protein DsbE
MRKIVLVLIVLISISLLMAEVMPDFKLPDINNKEIKLNDLLNNGPVLIDFWATWCVPCKKGMVALNQLAEKYDSLTVVVISIDAPKDVPKAKTYLKSNNYKFISLFDSEKKLAKKLNVVNPPRTIIIDKAGNIVLSHEGYVPGTENIYEAKIREMLALPALETGVPETTEPKETTPCGECK